MTLLLGRLKTSEKLICGRGETGRHVGFRFQCESVQVQVLSPVPQRKPPPNGWRLFVKAVEFIFGGSDNNETYHNRY